MQVNVKIDKEAGKRQIMRTADEALTLYRDEIIEDMNEFVPVSGGTSHNGGGGSLQQSAFLHSDQQAKDGNLTIRWDKPYARYQHEGDVMHGSPGNRTYGPDKLSYTSATARALWDQHAEKTSADNWAKGMQRLMGGR